MQIINGFDEILYTAIIFVPGLIFDLFRSAMWPEGKKEWQKEFLYYFTFGTLNLIVWGWLILRIYRENWFENRSNDFFLVAVLIIFVSPALFALLSVVLYSVFNNVRGWICKVFIRKSRISNYDTSWIYVFHNLKEERYLVITTNDNKKIYGKYTVNSYVSLEKEGRDIYLEECFRVDKEGHWTAKHCGIYIDSASIKTIEFYEGD